MKELALLKIEAVKNEVGVRKAFAMTVKMKDNQLILNSKEKQINLVNIGLERTIEKNY